MTPEANTPQPQVTERAKKRISDLVLISCVVVIWAAGVMLHDPWLRPWAVILPWCGVLTAVLLCLYLIFNRGYRVVALGLFVLMVIFVPPMPSFVRAAIVENRTKATVLVRFSSLDGTRYKEMQIAPSGKWRFVYFGGDNNGQAGIPSILEIRNLSSGALVRTQIDLPITNKGPDLKISEGWFSEKQLSN